MSLMFWVVTTHNYDTTQFKCFGSFLSMLICACVTDALRLWYPCNNVVQLVAGNLSMHGKLEKASKRPRSMGCSFHL